MPLVSMKPMLAAARDGKYGVGAFNILDYNSMLAIVRAAEELDAPVIVQVSVKTVKLWGHAPVVSWARQIAAESDVPVALHLDHCKDVDFVRSCIEAGWTSVMIDASASPFEQNLAMTREVLKMAEPAGIGVEAELGQIVGVEDDKVVHDQDAFLADPDQAIAFCKGLPLAVFAPAIGTAHGVYKGEPRIAFDRIETIASRTGLPIALHGGTGLAEGVFKKCIALGCAKDNISTQLKHVFIDSFLGYHRANPGQYEPVKVVAEQFDRMKDAIREKIELFGGAGRARDARD